MNLELTIPPGYYQIMRPEELIAEIYRQINSRKARGESAGSVVMNLADYRLLEWYRNFLGDAENSSHEYLGQYEIFGLEIFIEDIELPAVR